MIDPSSQQTHTFLFNPFPPLTSLSLPYRNELI
jgi:hypothetical protein